MKRFISLILSFLLILSFAACAATTDDPAAMEAPTPEQITESVRSDTPPADEYQRAIGCGFVPEELASADPDSPVTWAQYCGILGSMIAAYDGSLLPAWDSMTRDAPDTQMMRDGAMMSLLFAAKIMGLAVFNAQPPAAFGDYAPRVWDCVTMDYPVFDWDTPIDLGEGCSDNNHVGPAYDFSQRRVSLVSGKPLLEFDDTGDLRLSEPLTLREAALSALRLYESVPEKGEYIQLADVGAYDQSIITDALLSAPGDLPDATQSALPADWHGVGLSCCKDGHHTYRDFREADICFMADNGFNFARLFFGFSTLRHPDYPEDAYLVNENELRDLDQLIAWGIEYGVHIQISMSFMPDGADTLNVDEDEWALMRTIWTTLARRYAGIPNRYLSFDIANELEPDEVHFVAAVDELAQLYQQLRDIDPERVVLYSYQGNPTIGFVEALAKIGYAVGCHPYYPQYITTAGDEYAEQSPYAEPLWPLPWFPMGEICEGRAPLTLEGAIGGTTLALHVLDSYENASLDVYADGALLKHIALSGGTVENETRHYGDILFSVTIPEGTGKVEVWVRDPHARIDTILVEGSFGTVNIVPHDACDYMDFAEPLPLIINADGSYTNSENRIIDGEEIYRADIQPYHEIANKYGVGFMIGELGMFGNNVDWDVSIVAAYHDSVLKMLTEKGLPWCYCELYNIVDKHIVLLSGNSQWANTTVERVEVSCDGGTEILYVNKELLDTFRRYTHPDADYASAAQESNPAYMRDIGELTMPEFLAQLGAGYTCSALNGFDATVRYDPYQTTPVYLFLDFSARDGDEEYRMNWRWRLHGGKTDTVSLSLNELPDTPEGVLYNTYNAFAGAVACQNVPLTLQIENARLVLPDGTSVALPAMNGTFSTTAEYFEPPYQGQSWIFGQFKGASGSAALPDTATLQQSVFEAEVTLIEANGPDKAEYYYTLGTGNPPAPTAEWFRFLKSEGFDSIRFQVTWFNHTDDETYAIDEAWLDKVEETVRLALDAGLYCSINLNWDCFGDNASGFYDEDEMRNLAFGSNWLQPDGDPAVEERFAAVWTQIASRFADYDEHLMFESINEPKVSGGIDEAVGIVTDPNTGEGMMGQYETLGLAGESLNRLNQIFVDSVRATGGNNAQRFLFVTPYFSRGWEGSLREFALPEDAAGHTGVGINFYQLGENADDNIAAIDQYLLAKDIGVMLLEFGSSVDEVPDGERLAWLESVVPKLRERGIPVTWFADHWGQFAGHPLEHSPYFCLYNPYTMEPAFPEIVALLTERGAAEPAASPAQ